MPRTARPEHAKTSPRAAAKRLAKTVRRYGRVTKTELREAYGRVINADNVDKKEVNAAADAAAKLIPEVDNQIEAVGTALQFYLVRPRETSDVV